MATQGGSGDRVMPAHSPPDDSTQGRDLWGRQSVMELSKAGSPFAWYCSWFWTLNEQHPEGFTTPAGGTPVLFGSCTTAALLNLLLFSTVSR